MKDQIIKHLRSAALTFAAALGVELYATMHEAETWTDVGWGPALGAITFTAARSALKALLSAAPKD